MKRYRLVIGHAEVRHGAVVTHRDSYLLKNLSVVSVRKPLLGTGFIIGGGLGGFALTFQDLLYPGELTVIGSIALLVIIAGFSVGQLKLLSRDLRGSELSGAIWGYAAHLQAIRAEIVAHLSREACS
jgi:hypothetical protein